MQSNFIYSISDNNYFFDVRRLIKTLLLSLKKVCYISLNKSAESLKVFFNENEINSSSVIIVDMISSRFRKTSPAGQSYFLNIDDEKNLIKEINQIIEKESCEGVIVDSLSTMRVYYGEDDLEKFAHDLLVYSETNHLITSFIIQEKDEEKEWAKSIIPLAGGIKRLSE